MSVYTTLTNLPSETYMEKKKRLEKEKEERQEDIRKRLNRLTNAVKKHIEMFDTPLDNEKDEYVVLTIKKYKKRCLSFTKPKHMLYERDGSGNECRGQKRFVKVVRGMFNANALAYDECNHFRKRSGFTIKIDDGYYKGAFFYISFANYRRSDKTEISYQLVQ